MSQSEKEKRKEEIERKLSAIIAGSGEDFIRFVYMCGYKDGVATCSDKLKKVNEKYTTQDERG